ncbi:MAG: site-2 protease family protein [Defluviitaleaceae bacterium]|nr:site-2 protease family protein [Defluviitaleaceae bacterium]
MFYLLLLPGAFFAPVIHEWVKARVSAALGDTTPGHNGFITWNPFKFFEPIGFFMMMVFRVGWGRPVTTSPFYYRDKRKGIFLTYTAPIVANLLVGVLAIAFLSLFEGSMLTWAGRQVMHGSPGALTFVLRFNTGVLLFAQANIGLAVFNLIPVFPMAMNKLLQLWVSPEMSMKLNHYEKPMQILLFLFLIFGALQMFIFPIRDGIIRLVAF